jgi:CDGSH-type Zn-finger protein
VTGRCAPYRASANSATITPTGNGPYLIHGTVTLLDANGNTYQACKTIALCRRGHSNTKPFGDGTHEEATSSAVNRGAQTQPGNTATNATRLSTLSTIARLQLPLR